MNKFNLFLFLLLFQTYGYSQFVGDIAFGEIKKEISDSISEFYYPNLRKRLIEKDSTLKPNSYKYLYYGLVFQSYYHPYGTSNLKREFLDLFNLSDYQNAIEKGKAVLKENPVDLEVLLKMSISCLEVGDDHNKRVYAIQYYSFLDVIYESGDGKNTRSAFVVISVDHEYLILRDLALRVTSQRLVQDCDRLSIPKKGQIKVKGQKKIKELYFNVRMPLMTLSNSYKDADLPDPDKE